MSTPLLAFRRVLCLRLRSMGDAVLMTPALRALRQGLPDAEIHLLLDRELTALFRVHPHVDHIHVLGRGTSDKLNLARRLHRARFDAVINFHGGPTSAFLTAATGARTRVGRDNYRYGFFYNRKVQDPEIVFNDPSAIHTVHSQASLVTALEIDVPDLLLHLEVSDAAKKRLAAKGVSSDGYIVLQPTASFPSKQWPAERFIELARALQKQSGRDMIWSLPEAPRLGRRESTLWQLVDTSAPPIKSLEEQFAREFPVFSALPLDELTALMNGAALYVGNDSGPMHIAAALGKPVVGIFGSSNPKRWHPWGVPSRIIWAGLDCSPCHGKWCANPERFACLERIKVQEVLDAALQLLEKKSIR